MTLLQQMGAYFTAHTQNEVSTDNIHATAQDCLTKAGAIAQRANVSPPAFA